MVAWQYRNVFKGEKSHKWHFIDKEQFNKWSSQNDPSIELRKLFAHPRPVVPDGSKLVPVEPTEAMYSAADAALKDATVKITISPSAGATLIREPNRVIWKAMLAAAPAPELG